MHLATKHTQKWILAATATALKSPTPMKCTVEKGSSRSPLPVGSPQGGGNTPIGALPMIRQDALVGVSQKTTYKIGSFTWDGGTCKLSSCCLWVMQDVELLSDVMCPNLINHTQSNSMGREVMLKFAHSTAKNLTVAAIIYQSLEMHTEECKAQHPGSP